MSKIYSIVKQILFYCFLIAYVFLLAQALLFKEVLITEFFNPNRTAIRSLNVVPFQSILEYFSSADFNIWIGLMNVAGNIVLFIPMGIYLQIFNKNKKVLPCVALAAFFSLCVEILQYVLAIGYSDIDDLILNTIGGLLGILIYKAIFAFAKSTDKTKTAVTFLFCFVILCLIILYFILTVVFHYRIKIF